MTFSLLQSTKAFLEKNRGKKIVFTNGCFDILHKGHIVYLNEARALGDLLVVGLNSDRSVRSLKGSMRPIYIEEDRKFLLENLRSVDLVEIFDQETPLELIKVLSPDLLVKGGDWKVQEMIGYDFIKEQGGEVLTLSFEKNYSTTIILDRICRIFENNKKN